MSATFAQTSAATRRRYERACTARTAVLSAVMIGLFLVGCERVVEVEAEVGGGPEPLPWSRLNGTIFNDELFLVLPNRAWQRHAERDLWFFAGGASLVCYVREQPRYPIVFSVVPDDPGAAGAGGLGLEALWDGEDVTDRLRVFANRNLGAEELQLEIHAFELTPGTHYLTLRREAPEGSEPEPQSFRHVGYRRPGWAHPLDPDRLHELLYLSDLLTLGVTGSSGPEKLGGFVFAGPRTTDVGLPSAAGGRFSATLQNSSAGPALFTLGRPGERREHRLAVHERRRVEIAVPAGTRALTLSVAGDPNGLYLWGAPLFESSEEPSRRPVVLVTLDTTRREVLAAYGGDPAVAPHLNAFAESATVFDRAYATAPWTVPSHASIFTGLYPSRHGAGVVGDHLKNGFLTLAERLRDGGYLTAGFAGGMLSGFRFGMGQGFAFYRDPDGFETPADRLTDHVLELLRTHRSESLFLFVNYFDPHFPYAAPEPFQPDLAALRWGNAADAGWGEILNGSGEAWMRAVVGELAPTGDALAALRAAYLAEVGFMDRQIGRLFDALRSRGLYDEALIIVAADHGELLGEGGFFSHSARLDPELVEIPLLVKWPHQGQGRRVAAVASLVDLFPTVLRHAGLPVPEQDGLALDAKSRAELERRSYVVSEEHDADGHRLFANMKIADHLYGLEARGFRRLLWEDRSECWAAGSSGWQPETCPELDAAGRSLRDRLARGRFRPQVERIGMTDEERERLRALGYLQ